MKCVLALSFFLAVASAGAIHGLGVVPATGHVVSTPTASQYHAQDVLGQYEYGYSGPLSSKHEARSFDGVTRGGYSYVDGHGLVQSAEYVSDPHNGFRVAATNLPVGPGVPAPAVHAAPAVAVHAAPAVAVHAAPAVAVHAAPAVAVHAAPAVAVHAAPIATYSAGPSTVHVAPGSQTSQSSVVTQDGIVSHASVGHASVGPAVSHSSVVTHAGTTSVVSPAHHVAPLAHALAHPIAHSYVNPYALSLFHPRLRRSPGFAPLALGHLPASTAPLAHGVALAAPAVHAYAAPAVHAYAAPAVHAYAAPAVHTYAAPAAVSYSSTAVVHSAPAVAVHAAPAVAVHAAPAVAVHAAPVGVASTRHHSQDVLGQYAYGYNDGVSAKEEVRTHDGVTRGAYSYVDPRGVVQSVHYAADGHGFRAAATNILRGVLAVAASDDEGPLTAEAAAAYRPREKKIRGKAERSAERAMRSLLIVLIAAVGVTTARPTILSLAPGRVIHAPLAYSALAAPASVAALPISSQYHAQDELGQYSYGYAGGPSAKSEVKTFDGVTRGGYSYVDAEGKVQSVKYVADPVNGFRVTATNLPVAPEALPVEPLRAPTPVEDTPEVAAAREAHLAAYEEARAKAEAAPEEAATEEPSQDEESEEEQTEEPMETGGSSSEEETGGVPAGLITRTAIAYNAALAPALTYRTAVVGAPISYTATVAHAPIAYHAAVATPVAAYAAAPGAAISSQYHAQDEIGQYSYGYAGGPSTKSEVKTFDGVTRGGYSYVDSEGQVQSVNYVADPLRGFRVSATNLPVAPAAPEVPVLESVQETAEVAAARAEHLAAYEEAKSRLAE
ncbi:vitelline membrane-like protein [Hetaerina americana]|uniref:vitelline membrane-like protein n=1 Tax=Hetaerina americana TaxID=62018 RepID=UPI003A7F1214